jgi:hypothetical protein
MIPFLIAGAIGFGIAKLLEKDTKKYAEGGETFMTGGQVKEEWNSYLKDSRVDALVKAGYSKNVAKDLSLESWDSLEKQVQNAFKNVLISEEVEYMKSMMESLYTYGGLNKDNDYLSKYKVSLGNKLFNKTFDEYKKDLEEGYDVDYGTYTDSDGLTYSSLKRKLKEGGIIQDSWRKSGEGNLSIAETKKVAKKYAEGLTMSGEGIFTVNPKVEENSFDLDFNDEEYDGGSYIIYGDGSVVNMAVNPSERYGSINSTPTQIKNKFIDIQKQYKNAEFKDLIRNDGSVYGKRMVSELKYDNGGENFMAGGMTNEDILRSFLTSNRETQTNNLATFYSTLGAVMLLRNYGTLIAKRNGRRVEITNVKHSKTTSAITNRLKALAEEMGYNVSYVSEFSQGGMTEHGLMAGDNIIGKNPYQEESVFIMDKSKNLHNVNLDKGERYDDGGGVGDKWSYIRISGEYILTKGEKQVRLGYLKNNSFNDITSLVEELNSNPFENFAVSFYLTKTGASQDMSLFDSVFVGYEAEIDEDDRFNVFGLETPIAEYIGKMEKYVKKYLIEKNDDYAKGGLAKKRRRSASVQYGSTDKLVDKTRFAKPVGYRFTDEKATQLNKKTYTKPTEAQVKKYIGNGIYKESRRNRSDRDRKIKL